MISSGGWKMTSSLRYVFVGVKMVFDLYENNFLMVGTSKSESIPPPQPINTTSWHFCLTQFTPIRFNWSPRSLHPIHSSLASLRCLAPQRPRSYKGIAPMKEGHLFAFFNGGSILIQQNGMASQLKRNGMLPNSINGHFDGLLFWIHSILFNFWRVPRIVNQKT